MEKAERDEALARVFPLVEAVCLMAVTGQEEHEAEAKALLREALGALDEEGRYAAHQLILRGQDAARRIGESALVGATAPTSDGPEASAAEGPEVPA